MSPLRGRYYYGSYSSISDAWHNEVDFSMERLYEPKSMFIAGFAFDVLTLIALIGFLVWACLIRNPRGSLKGVVSSIVTWLIAAVLVIIYESFFLAEATLNEYYRIDLMIYDFLSLLSNCLVFFVFYNLIHGLLDRLTDAGKPYAVVAIIHWVILGIVSALSVAGWGLYVAYQVYDVNHTYSGSYSLSLVYEKVWAARTILYWVVSLEILAWTIFVFAKAGSHRFNSKTPAIALIIGSVFWFALNLMWTVVSIRYNLENTYFPPRYLQVVESVCQFFFVIGIYVGILMCCMNWSKLGNGGDKPAVTAQYPYGAVPSNYQAYQAYQPYPQQYAQHPQQVQQPYPQQPYPQEQQQQQQQQQQ